MFAFRRRRASERGLTLIEVMAALAVFSVAVIAIMKAGGENARAHAAMEERLFAGIVAENQLILAMTEEGELRQGARRGDERLAGRSWRWERRVSETTDPDLRQIDVVVRKAGETQALASLTAFRRAER